MRLGRQACRPRDEAAPSVSLPTNGHQVREKFCLRTSLESHTATDGYVRARDGVRLAVSDYGPSDAGHTVVFLHGLCLSRASWTHQIDHLVRRYNGAIRVISYDHRGHGGSDQAPMSSYRVGQLADDLAQVLTVCRVSGPLTLVGHSMGGMAALCYLACSTADRPIDAKGLVLVATAAGKLSERGLGRLLATPATHMLAGIIDHTPAQAWAILAGPLGATLGRCRIGARPGRATLAAVTAAALATTPLPTAAGFLPSLRSFDQYQILESIKAATVVVSGGLDVLTPPAHARDLAAKIPGAAHVHLPAAGHMLPNEAPDVVNAAIRRAIGPPGVTLRAPAGQLPA